MAGKWSWGSDVSRWARWAVMLRWRWKRIRCALLGHRTLQGEATGRGKRLELVEVCDRCGAMRIWKATDQAAGGLTIMTPTRWP